MRLSRNREVIAGGSIWGTATLFMVAIYVSHLQVSMPIFIVYLGSVMLGVSLLTWGTIESVKQKRLGSPRRV